MGKFPVSTRAGLTLNILMCRGFAALHNTPDWRH